MTERAIISNAYQWSGLEVNITDDFIEIIRRNPGGSAVFENPAELVAAIPKSLIKEIVQECCGDRAHS